MDINKKICSAGLKNNPNRALKSLDFITIHCTGNYSAMATAKNHADYQYNGSGGNQTSWHYTVDKDSIWQSFEDTQECRHAGNSTATPQALALRFVLMIKLGLKWLAIRPRC